MNIDPNAPAYPTFYADTPPGLTKREELIFRIAAGLAAHVPGDYSSGSCNAAIASRSIALADAVLAEINREKTT